MAIRSFIENHRIEWEIFLVIIGLIMGFVLAVGWGTWQNFQNDKYTAQEIYNDLTLPEHAFSGIGEGSQNEILPPQPLVLPMTPFTVSYPIHPSIEQNLQRFDTALSENITFYYANLTKAEWYRERLTDRSEPPLSLPIQYLYYNNMARMLGYCENQALLIKKQLHDIYGVQ